MNYSHPHRDFPAFHLHPMVVVRMDYHWRHRAPCPVVKKDIISLGCRNFETLGKECVDFDWKLIGSPAENHLSSEYTPGCGGLRGARRCFPGCFPGICPGRVRGPPSQATARQDGLTAQHSLFTAKSCDRPNALYLKEYGWKAEHFSADFFSTNYC